MHLVYVRIPKLGTDSGKANASGCHVLSVTSLKKFENQVERPWSDTNVEEVTLIEWGCLYQNHQCERLSGHHPMRGKGHLYIAHLRGWVDTAPSMADTLWIERGWPSSLVFVLEESCGTSFNKYPHLKVRGTLPCHPPLVCINNVDIH